MKNNENNKTLTFRGKKDRMRVTKTNKNGSILSKRHALRRKI
jgi:hypothetical protein